MKKKLKTLYILAFSITVFYTGVCAYGADYSNKINGNFIEKINYMLNDLGIFNIISLNNKEDNKEVYKPNHQFSMYEDLYYYQPENLTRYIRFSAKNTDILLEDVIWIVNMNLDKKFYEDSREIKDLDQDILLVNKLNYLPKDYEPSNLVYIENGKQATEETAEAYEIMKNDAIKEGIYMNVVSGYRSIEYQKDLYRRYLKKDKKEIVDTYSARAGYSEHHTGQALDLASTDGNMNNFGNTKAGAWVKENAWKYGFIVRYTDENRYITGYKSEPWHIRYVGTEISTIMHNEDIKSLEEYFGKYIQHTPPYDEVLEEIIYE